MLICKNCGEKLTKFNKEICPYCGCKKPLSNSIQETDTTKAIQALGDEKIVIKHKSLILFLILTCFLGIFGVEFLYLKKIKEFIISLTLNLFVYFLLFILFYFLNLNSYIVIFIPFLIVFIINCFFGIFLFFNKSILKDSNGVNVE